VIHLFSPAENTKSSRPKGAKGFILRGTTLISPMQSNYLFSGTARIMRAIPWTLLTESLPAKPNRFHFRSAASESIQPFAKAPAHTLSGSLSFAGGLLVSFPAFTYSVAKIIYAIEKHVKLKL
jgi:hypothetical protein